jgi:hypothetical protein
MALDSNSTYADMLAQYADNSSYSTAAEATLFVQACRMLGLHAPTRSAADGTSYDRGEQFQKKLADEIKDAEQFIASQTASNTARYSDMTNFR